ncbi:hypothetical protein Tco_1022353 [Tanacetum coccineum]
MRREESRKDKNQASLIREEKSLPIQILHNDNFTEEHPEATSHRRKTCWNISIADYKWRIRWGIQQNTLRLRLTSSTPIFWRREDNEFIIEDKAIPTADVGSIHARPGEMKLDREAPI